MTEPHIWKRASIYARSATDNPASIDNQRDALRAHAEAHGYEVVEEATDNGVSGNTSPFERPGLGAAVRDPAWDVLVVHDLSRVSRNAKGILQLEDWLQSNGKTLETADGLRFPCEGIDAIRWDVTKRIAHEEWLRRQEVARLIRVRNPSMPEDEVAREVARDQGDEPEDEMRDTVIERFPRLAPTTPRTPQAAL